MNDHRKTVEPTLITSNNFWNHVQWLFESVNCLLEKIAPWNISLESHIHVVAVYNVSSRSPYKMTFLMSNWYKVQSLWTTHDIILMVVNFVIRQKSRWCLYHRFEYIPSPQDKTCISPQFHQIDIRLQAPNLSQHCHTQKWDQLADRSL